MNKYEEALKTISNYAVNIKTESLLEESMIFRSHELLQELVDKATPKKVLDREDHYIPETYDYSHTSGKCPKCYEPMYKDYFNECNYCYKCGQALNWDNDLLE